MMNHPTLTCAGSSANNPFRRVFVIGLDGATLDLINPWTQQGHLPTLARLIAEGAHGPLESVMPPSSAPAWTTFATGLNPGKHGLFSFRNRISGSYDMRLVSSRDRKGRPLWQILSQRGLQVGVVNLPMTYPPEPVNGIFISGMDTPGGKIAYTHPPELAKELDSQLGEYIIQLPLLAEGRKGQYDKLFNKILHNLENRVATVKYLLTSYDLDFFAVNFSATDSVQHYFWHGTESARVLEVYQRLDDFLKWLITHMPQDTLLLVISDHGFGPAGDRAVFLNQWLMQQGYLAMQTGSLQRLPWQQLMKWLRYHTPDAIRRGLRRLWPQGFERARTPLTRFIDWPRTQVLADEQQWTLWINVAGRDPQGIVAPGAEYDALVEEIKERLLRLRDPVTNNPIFDNVYRRDEVYKGPMTSHAPDLLVLPATDPPYELLPSDPTVPSEFVTVKKGIDTGMPVFQGIHRRTGVFVAWGNGVRHNPSAVAGLRLIDVPPTILQALGCPIPREMDGRPLSELFEHTISPSYEDDRAKTEVEPTDTALGDQQIVTERLKGLGYID